MIADDISPLIYVLISLMSSIWCDITRPTTFTCPVGWHDEGVRPNGVTDCVQNPICLDKKIDCGDWDGTWNRPERSIVPPGKIYGRVYCTGGSRPIAVSDRIVGCQR